MTGKMDTKARRVRCPKCRSVLLEPSEVLLYKCGGCGAKLQAKKRNNSKVDTTSQRLDEDSSGKQKVCQDFVDQEAGSSSNQQSLLNSYDESNQNSDYNYLHSSDKDQDAGKRAENGTVDALPSVVEGYLHENLKMKQLSDDQEPARDEPDQKIHNDRCSSTEFLGHEDPESSPEATDHNRIDQEQEQEQNQKQDQSHDQRSLLKSSDGSDQNSDYNDLHGSYKDQDAAKKAENVAVDAPPSVVEEFSSEKLKMKQLCDNQEPCCSSKQQSLVKASDEPDQNIHNDRCSSAEFSGHEDPESSPEVTDHNRIDQKQEQNQKQSQSHHQEADDDETGSSFTQLMAVNSKNALDRNNDRNENPTSSELSYHGNPESSPENTVHNRVKRHEGGFISRRNETEIEESSSEFGEAVAHTRIISDSDGRSKPSFRSMIAEKLLDTRQKKAVFLDEDDLLSEDGSADLHHRRRFSRISSVETMENARFGGTSYYGYEGSVSSFDGNDDQIPRKNHTASISDEHVDSGNMYRFNRRNDLNGRLGKDDNRSFYGLNEFHENRRHHSPMIPENPRMERIELLKLVRELQDQIERTNISHHQQVPSYYNHVLNNPKIYGRRMAFSGEATAVNRRLDSGSCHHCCPQPQDRHFSAQLPHHHACCNRQHSHSRLSESDFSASDDHQQQRNDVTNPYRSPRKKQYVRPIAGGSPWITCYLCSKLLQLPQSFLLFNKRHHSLRCGACLKVLNFTLSNGTHVSRYCPEETIAPPTSEVEDFDTSRGSRARPVSYSDRSFEKSYSTETDRNGYQEFSKEKRKATMSRDPSGSTQPSSSKNLGWRTGTSEIEEVEPVPRPGPNGSSLHWLMGYPSPSRVIQG